MESTFSLHFFPLTSLQIGDLQSYLSTLTLFVAPESENLFILVDNRPWLTKGHSKHAHIWQLMVTKSRKSPFANTRARRERKDSGKKLHLRNGLKPSLGETMKLKRWFCSIYAAVNHKKVLLPVNELHQTFYGFILFEISWKDIRGINYLNELQTDTSLALEAQYMKKWEFDSAEQACIFVSSWFSGTLFESTLLKNYLSDVSDVDICGSPDLGHGSTFPDAPNSFGKEMFYDAHDIFPIESSSSETETSYDEHESLTDSPFDCLRGEDVCTSTGLPDSSNPFRTPSSSPCKRRKITGRSSYSIGEIAWDTLWQSNDFPNSANLVNEKSLLFDATLYKDVFVLIKFNDRNLPFRLRQIIMSDLRLLTLLESGLPSWAIFLQSYPVFCQFYRPWMRPLARILYVVVSFMTVLIGFYDLYKNVPVLKLTAARLCGPFFDWIESLEMVSRVKYLGTMLFLHNFEKAIRWLLMLVRATRALFSVLVSPVADPLIELFGFLLPVWDLCFQTVWGICSAIWIIFESVSSTALDVVHFLLWPLYFILSTIWYTVTWIIYPVFWAFWFVVVAPFRLIIALVTYVALLSYNIFSLIQECWIPIKRIFHVASTMEQTPRRSDISMLRTLWNDLFSQVFRAIRSILNVFVAFCAICNRHRLSIYNHLLKILARLSCRHHTGHSPEMNHRVQERGAQTAKAVVQVRVEGLSEISSKIHGVEEFLSN
ncbi:uncharacterized protein LOC116257864 isoform X2 [Nymphaea colorata]|nr:uncharacterized protein LOC116257864 isoform X2 [Nymphaea colorata]